MQDDFTDDKGKWLPEEGWVNLEVVSMQEGVSKQGNSKYTINFASAIDPSNGLVQDLTNLQGKRWLLRQLIEACGIEPEKNEEGRKIYNWEISDLEGKVISAKIMHDKTPFIGRDGQEITIPKAKIIEFRQMKV
jgi:hypothetical protein